MASEPTNPHGVPVILANSENDKHEMQSQEQQRPVKRSRYRPFQPHLSDLPLAVFMPLREILRDSQLVTVLVGPERRSYEEPKRLLCYYSEYFNRCLDGNFKEGKELRVVLDDVEPRHFEMMIYYMHNNRVCYPEAAKPADEINGILNFLFFADRMFLHGTFASVAPRRILALFKEYKNITAEHVRRISLLPRRHIMRKTLAEACVKNYSLSLRNGRPRTGPNKFAFHKEKEELEGFALDMSVAFEELVEKGEVEVRDPSCIPRTGAFSAHALGQTACGGARSFRPQDHAVPSFAFDISSSDFDFDFDFALGRGG